MTTEPTPDKSKAYWSDMSEGQQKLYQLCAEVTVVNQSMIESRHPLASSDHLRTLMRDVTRLFQLLENTTDFSSDERSTTLIRMGTRIRSRFQNLMLEATRPSHRQTEKSTIDTAVDPLELSQRFANYVQETGFRQISATKTNLEKGNHSGYGDYVTVSAERFLDNSKRVEYDEMHEWRYFSSPYLQGMNLLELAQITNPKLGPQDVKKIQPDPRDSYPIYKINIGPVRYSRRGHDYGGIHYLISVDCEQSDQVKNVSRFLFEMIKNNPRIQKN